MGYRSDCTLLMRDTDYNEMLDVASKINDKLNQYLSYIDEVKYFMGTNNIRYIQINWYNIKWYDDCVTSYLFDKDIYWEFVRIGEDYEDIQYDYNIIDEEECRLNVYRVAEVYCGDLEEI